MSGINYANTDFESIVLDLRNRLKLRGSWKDIGASGTGETLIELLAFVLTNGNYYTERRATESYLPTAKLLSSVKNLVALIGYQPKRKASAVGKLTFSIALPLTKNVYIPKYTSCKSASDVEYLTNEDVVIEKGQTSVIANSIQGKLTQLEISSNGAVSNNILINSTEVENSESSIKVVVDGNLWTKVNSFLNSDSDSTHYRVVNEIDGNTSVVFGDGVNGLIPTSGSSIVITYIKSAGLDGNVINIGSVTILDSTIYDEDGSTVTVTVTNSSSFLGGDDEEDIEEIRYEAPRVFKTGDRAVSKDDFITILENYSGVANANVWGENEEALADEVSAVQSMLNKVKMCVILQNWELLDDTFESTLSDYIYDESMITVKYEFVDPVLLDTIPVLTLKVSTGYSMSDAQDAAESAISDQFVLGGTTKLGSMIKYSNVIAAVDDLESIAYVNMVLEIRKELDDDYDSSCNYGVLLDATAIKPGTVRLFVNGSYVLTDTDSGDGTGVFSGSDPYTISGTINYETGVILLDINPSPTSDIHVRYQQDEDGNIVTTFMQIAKLYDVDVESISME